MDFEDGRTKRHSECGTQRVWLVTIRWAQGIKNFLGGQYGLTLTLSLSLNHLANKPHHYTIPDRVNLDHTFQCVAPRWEGLAILHTESNRIECCGTERVCGRLEL